MSIGISFKFRIRHTSHISATVLIIISSVVSPEISLGVLEEPLEIPPGVSSRILGVLLIVPPETLPAISWGILQEISSRILQQFFNPLEPERPI